MDLVKSPWTKAQLQALKPKITKIDFLGEVLPIGTGLVMDSGVYLGNGGVKATGSINHMIKTVGYDDYLTTQVDTHQAYHIGFFDDFSIDTQGYTMTSGVAVGLCEDWLHVERLLVNGLNTRTPGNNTQEVTLDTLGVHIIGAHSNITPRVYWGESEVKTIKVAGFWQGLWIQKPDMVFDFISTQKCVDWGLRPQSLPQINHVHIYGSSAETYTQGGPVAPRGIGVLYADGAPPGLTSTLRMAQDFPVLEIETCDIGVMIDGATQLNMGGEFFFYKNRKYDIALDNGAIVKGHFEIANGTPSKDPGSHIREELRVLTAHLFSTTALYI